MKSIILSCSSLLEVKAFHYLHSLGDIKIQAIASWNSQSLKDLQDSKYLGQRILHSEVMAWARDASIRGLKTQRRFGLEELERFKPYESDFFLMLDRSDTLGNMTLRERREAFIFCVEYWLGVVEDMDPQVVYFSGTPHEGSDFILFACCEVLGIETLMWQELYHVDGKILTRNWLSPWVSQLQSKPSLSISVKPEEFTARYQADYGLAEPAYNKVAKMETSTLNRRGWSLSKVSRLIHLFGVGLRGVLSNWKTSIKQSREKYALSLFGAVWWEFLVKFIKGLQMVKIAAEVQIARRTLAKLAVSEIPEGRYVAYFLHYEPELTVVPMGWVGGDQYIAIASLVKHLPEDWRVLVREHPAQYAQSFAGYFTGRNKDFYNRLLGIGRVTLASQEINTFDLIDKSEFVSTITGTVGWEALVRGKPSLIFGNAWYSEAPGVYICKSEEDLKDFIHKISSNQGSQIGLPTPDEIIGFVENLFQHVDKIVLDLETAQLNGTEWDPEGAELNLRVRLREALGKI